MPEVYLRCLFRKPQRKLPCGISLLFSLDARGSCLCSPTTTMPERYCRNGSRSISTIPVVWSRISVDGFVDGAMDQSTLTPRSSSQQRTHHSRNAGSHSTVFRRVTFVSLVRLASTMRRYPSDSFLARAAVHNIPFWACSS